MPVSLGSCVDGMKLLAPETFQVVIADPPYNIGKDFGNDSDRQSMERYLEWCSEWIGAAYKLLTTDGTMYIYGFPEILAHVQVRCVPPEAHIRWLQWHYTNKTTPSAKFWQRSHESILCIWKRGNSPHFNLDDVREKYTENFLKNSGKKRAGTAGRFGSTETTYTAHEKGAMPRDIIKVPALAGGAGAKERVNHPTQKPLELCKILLKASQKPGCNVLVPFAGSGSECVAAEMLGLNWTAFEINSDYVAITQERIAALHANETPGQA